MKLQSHHRQIILQTCCVIVVSFRIMQIHNLTPAHKIYQSKLTLSCLLKHLWCDLKKSHSLCYLLNFSNVQQLAMSKAGNFRLIWGFEKEPFWFCYMRYYTHATLIGWWLKLNVWQLFPSCIQDRFGASFLFWTHRIDIWRLYKVTYNSVTPLSDPHRYPSCKLHLM